MLLYKRTYIRDENTIIVVQLMTTCCHDEMEFIKQDDGNYVNVKMGNVVADGWKDQINKAIKEQSK